MFEADDGDIDKGRDLANALDLSESEEEEEEEEDLLRHFARRHREPEVGRYQPLNSRKNR